MKKETKKRCLCLFGLVVLCLSGVFCAQIKAEDAFVVEEEAVIGGDAAQEEAQPITPVIAPSEVPEVSPPADTKVSKKPKKAEGIEKPVIVSRNSISENSVSQNMIAKNSPPPVFQVPVRKQVENQPKNQPEKSILNQTEPGETEELLQRELPQPQRKNPWWLLVISAVFFMGGCARLAWKRRDCRKNDALYV